MMVTKYKSIKTDKDNPEIGELVSLESVLDEMKNSQELKEIIEEISSEQDKKKRSWMKVNRLPVVCFNGKFKERKIDGVLGSSSLIVLDVDGLRDTEEAIKTREQVSKNPFVVAAFVSPSAKGIKFLVKIPSINGRSPEEIDLKFKGYFQALSRDFPFIDPSGKDISRACFYSYDPDMYINYDATVYQKWEEYKKSGEKVEGVEIPNIDKSSSNDLNFLRRKVAEASDGSRHDTLYNMSRLAGGFISAGRVTEDDAIKALSDGFKSRDYDIHYNYEKTISDGIEVGIPYPKYQEEEYMVSPHPDDKDDDDTDFDMYVPFEDYENEADDLYKNGNPKGLDSRFKIAREFISYRKKFTTYIYSAPFSGKTQFAMSELTYLAERYDWKIAVFSLELGEPQDVLAEVASIYIGRLYNTNSKDLKMNQIEHNRAKSFFKEHFYVLDPVYKKSNIESTVNNILKEVAKVERKFNIHFDCVYIDPISELDDGGEERIHKFTHNVNKMVNLDAKFNNRHNFLVSHVRDQQGILDKTENKMYYPVPTPRDVSGGQNTYKQGYQMICVYRPPSFKINDKTKEFHKKNETQIHIQKAKPKGVGKIGDFTLYYDWKTNRYYEDENCTIYSEPVNVEEQAELTLETTYTQPVSKEHNDFSFDDDWMDEEEDVF